MLGRLKVLVVDDDQLTLEMLGCMLAAEDVEVLGLRDPREANALINKERFDGIFLDLTMPGLNGVELAGQIRASAYNSSTPIVVITGRADSSAAMKEAFAAGAHFFLAKPLDREKVRQLLKSTRGSLLRERRANRRVPLAVDICCCAGTRTLNGVTSQISEQTVVFHVKDQLRLGEFVYITFRLPSSHSVEGTGVIVPADGVGSIACQFGKLDDAARESVRGFVASVRDAS